MKKKQQDGRSWALIGIPDHEGVLAVRGRLGAALGPRDFREIFGTFRGREQVQECKVDCGDALGTHDEIASQIQSHHASHGVSIVVGGGHDHGYSQLKGVRAALPKKARLGCINIDAHLDVRSATPVVTSGSPFFLAIERGVLNPKNLIEFGTQRHCNGPELWNYVESRKVPVVPFESMRLGTAVPAFKAALAKLSKSCDAIVLSFDLDSVPQAFAPGVSAPQSEGFLPREILEFMKLAGQNKKVISLGIFELNPLHDQDRRTARLAATSAYHFLAQRIHR